MAAVIRTGSKELCEAREGVSGKGGSGAGESSQASGVRLGAPGQAAAAL